MRQRSSVVEQWFCKPLVAGSNPPAGSRLSHWRQGPASVIGDEKLALSESPIATSRRESPRWLQVVALATGTSLIRVARNDGFGLQSGKVYGGLMFI